MKDAADFPGERRRLRHGPYAPVQTIHEPLTASRGTVYLLPGWSGPRTGPADILVFLASELARAGFTAVRLDLPGRGDHEGSFCECDLDAMIGTAVDALREEPPPPPMEGSIFDCRVIDVEKVRAAMYPPALRTGPAFLVGMCSGGNVALGAATDASGGQRPAVAGVAAISTLPFQPARSKQFEWRRRWRNVTQYLGKAASPRTWARLLRGDINLQRVKKNVLASEKPNPAGGGRNLKDSARDIEAELKGFKTPLLFVWGGGDEEAGLARAHFQALHAQGMGAPGRTLLHTVAGANHNFYAKAWREELARTLLDFMASTTPQK